jgi:hypothetical protein
MSWIASISAAWAGTTVSLDAMVDHEGLPVLDRELLGASYRQLVKELGALVSNKPVTPCATTGVYGFEMDLGTWFVLNDARNRDDLSPWTRVDPDEVAEPYSVVPVVSVRKGLPLSTEVEAHVGWLADTSTGLAGVQGRIAILEGFRPLPEVTGHLGWAGWVGNDDLEVGVFDLGVQIGTTVRSGSVQGANTATFRPWLDVSSLRVSAAPLVEAQVAEDIGAVPLGGGDPAHEPALVLPQLGAGLQAGSRGVHVRFAVTWVPAAIPTVSTGVGFTL